MTFKYLINRTGLKIKKYSPEILTGVGVVTFVGTIIYACKQSTKAHDILEKYHEEMDEINEAVELAEQGNLIDPMGNNMPYEKVDIRRDKFGVMARTGVGFVKLYAGPAILGSVSIASFLSANHILKTRYLGAVAAFNIVSNAFEKYRERVISDGGVDLDRSYMYGAEIDKQDIIEIDEEGKKKKTKVPVENLDSPMNISQYARFFDESCPDWTKSAEANRTFLLGQQAIADVMLKTRGHLFLNEVYDMLGMERTAAGALVGWVLGNGDNYVDFGLYDASSKATRRFVNGVENVILLDFNVDGIIFDKLDMMSEGSGSVSDVYDYVERMDVVPDISEVVA